MEAMGAPIFGNLSTWIFDVPGFRKPPLSDRSKCQLPKLQYVPAPPNCPLRDPKYHLIETIRPLIELHWGV